MRYLTVKFKKKLQKLQICYEITYQFLFRYVKHTKKFSFSCEIVHNKTQEHTHSHRKTCLDINNHQFRIKLYECSYVCTILCHIIKTFSFIENMCRRLMNWFIFLRFKLNSYACTLIFCTNTNIYTEMHWNSISLALPIIRQ